MPRAGNAATLSQLAGALMSTFHQFGLVGLVPDWTGSGRSTLDSYASNRKQKYYNKSDCVNVTALTS